MHVGGDSRDVPCSRAACHSAVTQRSLAVAVISNPTRRKAAHEHRRSASLPSLRAARSPSAAVACAQDITGAGASFPAPIYAKWADAYNKATGVRINYQSVGSGAGIKQIKAKTVDFGASDMPLKDEELAKDGLIQFPTVIGGVVPVVNISGIKPGQLKLTGQVLGDIYLGKITKWNDPAHHRAEPGRARCRTPRSPSVRRADGSGTSFIFTNYLSKVNAEWKAKVGEGTAVNWPTGAGGKGNEGVAGLRAAPAELDRLRRVRLRQAEQDGATRMLKNQAGNFVAPDDATFKAAAAGADWNKSFYQVLTDQPGKDTWPITGATFILMHKAQDKPANAASSAEVLRLGLHERRQDGRRARLRAAARLRDKPGAQARGAQIKDASGKAVALQVSDRRADARRRRLAAPLDACHAERSDPWPLHFPRPPTDSRDDASAPTPAGTPPSGAPRLALGRHGSSRCWRTARAWLTLALLVGIIVSLVVGAVAGDRRIRPGLPLDQPTGIRCRRSSAAW